jgi:crotonobetainyl-CoA:carnitine CoA-transferase CaiB-like acyl-CoA transferase
VDILGDVNVVDFSTEIAGPYATKLLADAGADVVKIEKRSGDPLRYRSASDAPLHGDDSALFRYLNASKRSIIGEPGDEHIEELVGRADLIVESFVPAVADIERWRRKYPGLVVLSLTPYGRVGPWVDRPATEFTVQAEAGSILWRGRKDQVPYQAGGRIFEWSAGVFGVVGALAALFRARQFGIGEQVDCSWLASTTFAATLGVAVENSFLGRPTLDRPARVLECPSIEPTKDGLVGFMAMSGQHFQDFLAMIERGDLTTDERWASGAFRYDHVDEWNEIARPWMLAHTTAEIIELATLFRIPVARVNDGETVTTEEHFKSRNVFEKSQDGDYLEPGGSYKIDGERPRARGRAPRLGEHTHSASESLGGIHKEHHVPRRPWSAQPDEPTLPLSGLRVLDATAVWAGPSLAHAFGALGADVVHLEALQHPDHIRMSAGRRMGQDRWWEWSSPFFQINTNKRDLTLDLSSERGREVFAELVRHIDLLVENFSPRVFDSFGFSRERILEINPQIVFVRMPAFGLDGPWRDNTGLAQTMEQMTGLAWVTGHADDESPKIPRGPCDPIAGYHAAFAALVALWRRQNTDDGAFVEAAMVESALCVAAELVLEYGAYGALLGRDGNRGPDAAPQGLYPCRGFENWLALAVETDEHWASLREVLENPGWMNDPELVTVDGRRKQHDAIDAQVAAWARDKDVDAVVEELIKRGVPAGRASDPRTTDSHVQLQALGFFEVVDHPVVGRHPVSNLPFRYESVKTWIRRPAPLLGQHNAEILTEDLGYSEEKIAELEDEKVIGMSL